jgi:hypothetical protein
MAQGAIPNVGPLRVFPRPEYPQMSEHRPARASDRVLRIVVLDGVFTDQLLQHASLTVLE